MFSVYLDRKKITSHLRDPEHIKAMSHVLDKVEISIKKGQAVISDFYDPFFIYQASQILNGLSFINHSSWGGFDNAERKRICVAPEYFEINESYFDLSLVVFKGNFNFFKQNHRHALGAILNTGIKREKTGDIIVVDNICQVIVDSKISNYLASSVLNIGPVSVKAQVLPIEKLLVPENKLKEINITVSSLRLDAVISGAFSVSRSKASELLKREHIKVNWQQINRLNFLVKKNDIISVRGKGRVKILEIGGKTKKNRIIVKVGIFT